MRELMSKTISALNPTYTRWIEEAVGRTFASEPKANCANCTMCQAPTSSLRPSFLPDVKCCTYWPDLPNFMVGRALRAGGTGAQRLRQQIEQRRGVTPFGIQASPSYQRRYEEKPGKFGMDLDMICPYYDHGDCTIWANRNAICQTYFCRSEEGVQGQAIWKQLTLLLALIEEKLSVAFATRHLKHPSFYTEGFQPNGTTNRVATRSFKGWIDEDGTISPALYNALWGEWQGREIAFFEACAHDFAPFTWADILKVVGPEAAVLATRLRAIAERPLPQNLRPATPGVAFAYEEGTDHVAYTSAAFDVHTAPIALWNALMAFEGGPLTDAGLALPGRVLSLTEAVELWKTGLLIEGKPIEEQAISPKDRLRVRGELPIRERILFSETGQATVEISIGVTEISFDEPDLLHFGRSFYARRQGFIAEEATAWSGRSWEQTAELLASLFSLGVLERI